MRTICFLLITITMVFLVSQAGGAEWVSLGENILGTKIFYDRETLTKLPNEMVKVWQKEIYSDKDRIDAIQRKISLGLNTKGYDQLNYTLALWEVNCGTREQRVITGSDYATDGRVLFTHTIKWQPTEGWNSISPESTGEALYRAVCPPQKKK